MIPAHPLLYEVPARTLIESLRSPECPQPTLADVPDAWCDALAAQGFHLVWLMGVWQLGPLGRKLSLEMGRQTGEFDRVLPGWTPEDVTGSPYCVQDYRVHEDFGGNGALEAFRQKLRGHGLGLILDFVPNHTARDHRWVSEHPEYYVAGDEELLRRQPGNYAEQDGRIFAHGRDPYFPGWADVFQLDYRKEAVQQAMMEQMERLTELCDGLRCDMSMLLLPEVFARTWGPLPAAEAALTAKGPFWGRAIDRVRAHHPDFLLIAEAYWGLEYRLQMEGFNHTYDKTLYDHLAHRSSREVYGHIASWTHLFHGVHFLENHDEPRAAATFPDPGYRHAATVLLMALPGLRLVYDGQRQARQLRYVIHLRRAAPLPAVPDEPEFFSRLLGAVRASAIGRGQASHVPSRPAWSGSASHEDILALLWTDGDRRDLVVVNLSQEVREARLPFFFTGMGGGRRWHLADRLSGTEYVRDGDEMGTQGLYVKMQPFQAQIFAITRA